MARPITIDISPSQPESQTESMRCPRNWAEAEAWLGTTEPTIKKCRLALGREDDPLDAGLYEEIRLMVRWCDRRNKGGGSRCTRREYMRLKGLGQDVLDQALKQQGVI